MYGQENYPPFRPPAFQQARPNHPPLPPFQQAPPPGPPPPPFPLNPLPPPPPPQYQYGGPPPQQPGPSYTYPSLPLPLPVQGNFPMPHPYSQPNASYPLHNFSLPIPPPPRMLTPPPPLLHSQGQVLYRIPPPPPPGLQHVPAPPPPAPLSSSFFSVTPSPFPPAAPPPSPPPPPSSPPPLPSSPPPPTSPTTEFSAFPKVLSLDTATLGIADTSVAPNDSEVGKSENNSPVAMTRAFEDLPSSAPKPADEKDSVKDEEQNVPSQSAFKEVGSSQSGIVDNKGGAISPAARDREMEDDISQPDVDNLIDQPSRKLAGEALSLGSEFHAVNNSLPAPSNATEQPVPEPAASSILSFTDGNDSSFLEDVSPVRAEPNAAEQALENNVQQCVTVPTEDSSKFNASSTHTGGETLETPAVPVKDENPFHLIQCYASDDSDEDDRRDGTEGSPAAAIESISKLQTDSRHPSPSSKSKEEFVGRSPSKAIVPLIDPSNEEVDLPDDDKWNDKTTKCKSSQTAALLDGDYMDADHQVEKHHLKEDANPDFAKVKVDEFGRMVRKGESCSDSDEVYLNERPSRRGRSRSSSWSRSPQESRRRWKSRSPKRREKRRRSHSWSPRRTRSMSPPTDRQMNAISIRDWGQPPECLDYKRGRCFRGASCRFLHHDSARHVSKRKRYLDITRDPEKHGNHDLAPSSELDKTAAMEMDIEECNEVPQEDPKSTEIHSHREKSGDTANNDVREGSNQISHEVANHEISHAEDVLEEAKSTGPPLNSSQILQTNSTLVQSASLGSNISQLQDVAQLPQEGSKSHHPLPHPHMGHALANQMYASQSPVHSHTNIVTSNSSQSLPSKDSSPTKFSGPDVNFQPSQQGPPGPPPLHYFPSDNQNALFPSQHPTRFQSQPLLPNIFPSHRPPMVSDYNSQNTLPNPGWYGMPPPPTSRGMLPRHDFHPQAFQSVEPSQQPPFGMDELGRRPLPMGNHHDHPIVRDDRFLQPPMPNGPQIMPDSQRGYHLPNPSFSHVETHIPFPGQGFSSSISFMNGSAVHPQPLPREPLPNILHSFPGEHVGARPISREDVSSAAIKDVPYSHNPPPHGQLQNVNSSYPLNLPGSVDPSVQRYPLSFLDNRPPHYNPFASTFEQVPAGTKDVSRFSSNRVAVSGPGGQILPRTGRMGLYLQENVDVVSGSQKLGVRSPVRGDSYDPLLDSIEPSSNMPNQFGHIREPSLAVNDAGTTKLSNSHNPANVEDNNKQKGIASTERKPEVDDFGDGATDAEVGVVENASPSPVDEKDWSPDLPIDMGNVAAGEIEVDQVQSPGRSKKSKDSRSMKLFKSALADFVKEVLKPSWRQGNMSKEAFKTIVKKTVEKVSGGMPSHHIPKSEAKINQYVESSQRKLTKLVMGYVDKYVKM